MLIYGYKGKCCPTSITDMNEKNIYAILYYNRDVLNKGDSVGKGSDTSTLLRQVYNTYSTLCKFNNSLTSIQDKTDTTLSEKDYNKQEMKRIKAITDALALLEDYLTKNEDIVEQSYDTKIRNIYDDLRIAYNRLSNNTDVLDEIKKKIVGSMKFYEKLGLFQVASINQQKNYDDYT